MSISRCIRSAAFWILHIESDICRQISAEPPRQALGVMRILRNGILRSCEATDATAPAPRSNEQARRPAPQPPRSAPPPAAPASRSTQLADVHPCDTVRADDARRRKTRLARPAARTRPGRQQNPSARASKRG